MAEGSGQNTLGRYELLERLGAGSATEAFRAKSFGVEGFEKTLVVKRVLPELALSEAFIGPFLEHVQRSMRLSHANLAQVFDLGRAAQGRETAYFIATEYVSGLDVATLLERARAAGSPVPLALAAYLALEVAKALDHAHRRRDEKLRPLGIVHGGVAPHNVLVSFDGDVKLTDFGATRALLSLPRTDALVRLYQAVSPEQARGRAPTPESDVFSLGVFVYAAISGVQPFAGERAEEVLERVARADPVPLEARREDVPLPLADLVHRALAADPADRFPSISSMHEELLACTYACGLRWSQGDLAAFVDQHREPPATVPAETIDALLSRPLTAPPPPPDEDVVDDAIARPTSVPPLTGFGELRHVSALVLGLREPLTEPLRERLHATLARYGGEVARDQPGQVTALFGLDRSDGRDTEAAVRCGLVLARALDVGSIAPTVGIDTGRLRLGPGDRPAPDDRAERLVGSARGLTEGAERAVLVSKRVASSIRGRFPLEPHGSGFQVTEFAQDRFLDPFVGRRSELAHLGDVLAQAAGGELRVLGIVGEAGAGKTRLVVEMQRRLGRGRPDLRTFFATCPPRGRELPLSGIVAMLRRISGVRDGDPAERIRALEPRLRALGLDADEVQVVLSELGAASPGRVPSPTALRTAVTRMMHSLAEDGFTVFAWDDAHELDAASAELLTRASTRLSSSRIAIVLAARPDPGAPYQVLPVHSELRVGEMPQEDVDELVRLRLGVDEVPGALRDFLRDRAGGQPMFVEELLRQLHDGGVVTVVDGRVASLSLDDGVGVPRSLRALTADRLRRLTDDERHLFVAAAVLEPPVDSELLAAMVGLATPVVESVAEPLVASGLLGREGPAAFGFPTPLAREVVLAELDPEDLAALHRRAAEAHERLFGEDAEEEADRIGYHLAAAGDRDGAADLYARSGLHYVAARQLDRAALDLAYALDLSDLETRPPPQIENWLRALSTSVRYVRSGPNLPALIERIVRRVEGEGLAPEQKVGMRVDLAYILGALDDQLAAESLLDRGAPDARAGESLLARLLAARADLASSRGDFRLARRALDPLARLRLEDPDARHRAALSTARALGASGNLGAADDALILAQSLAAPEDPLLALDRAAVRTALYGYAGRWREAAEAAVQAASQAEELGLLYEVASSLSEQAAALVRLGDSARARASVASALSAAEEVAAPRLVLRSEMLMAYLQGTDLNPAVLDTLRARVATAESHGWIQDALLGRYLLGRVALRLGSNAEARRELALAARIAASTGSQVLADECNAELANLGA